MEAQDWTTSGSTTFTTGFCSHDVFLNFRGEDTRKNFTGLLHLILKDRGIDVFIDSKNLWGGEAIGPALYRAIEGSKISIPIFSKSYAYSKWCLLELAQIVQCHKSNCQMVLPIFFNVEPSHVRNQIGCFEKAFQEHEKNFEPSIIESWRKALRVVGNLTGEVIDENKDQADVVELVVKRVQDELISRTHLAECKYPIGMDSRAKDVLSLLNIGSNDVQFVGICGIGGIGKTAIAKVVYNRLLSNFKRHSFISNIREQAMHGMGLVSLQKRLLKDIFGRDIDIGDHHRGKNLIERRLCKENVLLVLDDVDRKEQVDALAGELNWFGQGSRVIITTKAEHILNVAKVDKDKIYWPQLLNRKESLQLFSLHAFSLHAFSEDRPPHDYMRLSHDVVRYGGGLPLNLELLGSYLSDTGNKEVWKSILQKLKAGITPFSGLASLCVQGEKTCPMQDNPSGWCPLLDGNTTQKDNTVHALTKPMSYGNNTTFARVYNSTGEYLNANGSTTTVRIGKWFMIKAKIQAALSKFTGDTNLNVSTAIDKVGKQFRIADIRAATKNFNRSMVIGEGGFGKVYKGEINGTLVAVKRHGLQSRQSQQEFESEIKMLSELRYRHVVSMIGFCKEKNEMIIVFEYMAKGNLGSHIFRSDLPPLTWKQRLEICIGAAHGLHYVHTWTEIGIIHRDVKPSNILLDENFVAKIADFGLSRTGPALDHTHVSTRVMGTYGYHDPEYIMKGHLSKKCDVYSFGIVLLEVACGRRAIENHLAGDQYNLVHWAVKKKRQRSLETIVDRRLERNYSPESLKKFGEIIRKCVALKGKHRPTMEEVLWDLEYALELHEGWLRSNAGKNPSVWSLKNVGVGETPESHNTINQEDEISIDLRTEDDDEPLMWRTSFPVSNDFSNELEDE